MLIVVIPVYVHQGLHSILRKSSKGIAGKAQIPRARLSPLVLLLDGALVGELDTVQRAVQEVSLRPVNTFYSNTEERGLKYVVLMSNKCVYSTDERPESVKR